MRKIFYYVLVLAAFTGSEASALPVATGTYPIPSPRFSSLKSIIDTLNTFGIAGGTAPAVTINLTTNEARGPYILGTCVLNPSAVPIIINGGGNTITAHAGSGERDAIFMIRGKDNVTITNFKFVEAASNTTAATMMEWGIAALKNNNCGMDGIQTLNVTDCEIILNKNNTTAAGGIAPAGSSGIFIGNSSSSSRSALNVPPSLNGANRFFYIARNKITNVNHGIWCAGVRANTDGSVNNDAFLTLEGNTVSNFTHNGIAISHFNSDQVQINTINNMKDGGAAPTDNTIFGIRYINDPSVQTNADWTCARNNINLTINTSGTSHSAVGIMTQISGNGFTDINTDTVKLTSIGPSALLVGIFSQNEQGTQTISKNNIRDFTTQTTNGQAVVGIHAGGYSPWTGIGLGSDVFPSMCTVSENKLDNFSVYSGATAITSINLCSAILSENLATGTLNISRNTVSNFRINGSSKVFRCFGSSLYTLTSQPRTTTIAENKVSNISTPGANNTTPIDMVSFLGGLSHTFSSVGNSFTNISANGPIVSYSSDYCTTFAMEKDTLSNMTSATSLVIGLVNARTKMISKVLGITIFSGSLSSEKISVKDCSFSGLKSNSTGASGALGLYLPSSRAEIDLLKLIYIY